MALRQINMIPANVLARTVFIRHLGFWGRGLICIFLFFAICYLAQFKWLAKQGKAHSSDSSATQKISEKINQTLLAKETLLAQMQDLAQKSGQLVTLANHLFYYDILAVLARSFNDATWIDQLTLQRPKDKNKNLSTLLVQGFSLTHHTLGEFLDVLSGHPGIQDIVLVYAKKQDPASPGKAFATSSAIRFELTCTLSEGVSR